MMRTRCSHEDSFKSHPLKIDHKLYTGWEVKHLHLFCVPLSLPSAWAFNSLTLCVATKTYQRLTTMNGTLIYHQAHANSPDFLPTIAGEDKQKSNVQTLGDV